MKWYQFSLRDMFAAMTLITFGEYGIYWLFNLKPGTGGNLGVVVVFFGAPLMLGCGIMWLFHRPWLGLFLGMIFSICMAAYGLWQLSHWGSGFK